MQHVTILPVECLIEIARQGNWLMSGPLARCSKASLLQFTNPSVLKEIILSIKVTNSRLVKWLVLALPSKYFYFLIEGAVNPLKPDPCILKNEGLLGQNIFVSGGSVCQNVYHLEWKADIDIYVDKKYITERTSISRNGKVFDIVPTCHMIERVIENFDLSIVQQGFMGDIYYLTPLSFYTQFNKEIIAMPNETNIQYTEPCHVGAGKIDYILRTVDIWHYIEYHEMHHKLLRFHECNKCVCFNIDLIISWYSRVKKYCDRFPNFTIAYCKPPNITRPKK